MRLRFACDLHFSSLGFALVYDGASGNKIEVAQKAKMHFHVFEEEVNIKSLCMRHACLCVRKCVQSLIVNRFASACFLFAHV